MGSKQLDTDRLPCFVASDLGLHYYLRFVCLSEYLGYIVYVHSSI